MTNLDLHSIGRSPLVGEALSELQSLPRDILNLYIDLRRMSAHSEKVTMPEAACHVTPSRKHERAWAEASSGELSIISWDAEKRELILRDQRDHAWQLRWSEPYRGAEDWLVQSVQSYDWTYGEGIPLSRMTYSAPSPQAMIPSSLSADPMNHIIAQVYQGLKLPSHVVSLPQLAICFTKKIQELEDVQEFMGMLRRGSKLKINCAVVFQKGRKRFLHGICLRDGYAIVFGAFWIADGSNVWMVNQFKKTSPKDALFLLSHNVPREASPCSIQVDCFLDRFRDISDEVAEANFAELSRARQPSHHVTHDNPSPLSQCSLNLCNATDDWRCPIWMNARLPNSSRQPAMTPSELSSGLLLKRLNKGKVTMLGLPQWIGDHNDIIQLRLSIDTWVVTISAMPWPDGHTHQRGWVARQLTEQPHFAIEKLPLRWERQPEPSSRFQRRAGDPADAAEARRAEAAINALASSLEERALQRRGLNALRHQLKHRLRPGRAELQSQLDAWRRLCELELTYLDGTWVWGDESSSSRGNQELILVLSEEGSQAFKKWFNQLKDDVKKRSKRDGNPLQGEETWTERTKLHLLEDKPWHHFQLWVDGEERTKLRLRGWVDENRVTKLSFSPTRHDQFAALQSTVGNNAWALSAPSHDNQIKKYKRALKALSADHLSEVDQDDQGRDQGREDSDPPLGALSLCRALSRNVEPFSLSSAPISWSNPHLSPAQQRAVRAALDSPDFSLIQGPPGTGKTTVILELVTQLFKRIRGSAKPKVLMVAPTHIAVDNLLERLVTPRRTGEMSIADRYGIVPVRFASNVEKIQADLTGYHDQIYCGEHLEKTRRNVETNLNHLVAARALQERQLELLDQGFKEDWARLINTNDAAPIPVDSLSKAKLSDVSERVRLWRNRNELEEGTALIELLSQWSSYIEDAKQEFNEELQRYGNLFLCTTALGGMPKEFQKLTFDVVIMDEAGKEESRRALIPLTSAHRWVLVGDHKQLPPFVDDDLAKRASAEGLSRDQLERSLFESLFEVAEQSQRHTFLDRQGRMHPMISNFVSQTFYQGELGDFPNVGGYEVFQGEGWPRHALSLIDTREHRDKYERNLGDGQLSNRLEVRIVFSLLERLQGEAESPYESIGVICPYKSQLELLEHKLKFVKSRDQGEPHLDAFWKCVQLGTIDSFQGQEKSLIIFTATRSNTRGALGFTDHEQRLNVAFSRAKRQLIVILDSETVEIASRRFAKHNERSATSIPDRLEHQNRSVFGALIRYVDDLKTRLTWNQTGLGEERS